MSTLATGHRECPGCGADLTGSHGKRKWCSENCRRKTMYGGICEACGGPTNGNDGPGKAPKLCAHCAPGGRAKWSRDRIVEKIREWVEAHGSPPVVEDWNPAIAHWRGSPRAAILDERYESGDWPSSSSVVEYFGTWNEAILAAEFVPLPSGKPRHFRGTEGAA